MLRIHVCVPHYSGSRCKSVRMVIEYKTMGKLTETVNFRLTLLVQGNMVEILRYSV